MEKFLDVFNYRADQYIAQNADWIILAVALIVYAKIICRLFDWFYFKNFRL